MKDYFLLISTGRQQGRDSSELHLLLSLLPYLQLQVSTSPLNIRKDTKNRNLRWPTCTWIFSVSVSTRGFQHFGFSSLLSTYLKHSLNSLDITIWVTWSFTSYSEMDLIINGFLFHWVITCCVLYVSLQLTDSYTWGCESLGKARWIWKRKRWKFVNTE